MKKVKNTEIKRALCFGCWLQTGAGKEIKNQ